MRRFKLFNKDYELVAVAKDQSKANLGKIAVYRIVGTQVYYSMPLSELASYFNSQKINTADLNRKVELFKEHFVGRTDVYAKRYFNKRLNKKMYSPAVAFKNGQPIRDQFVPLTDDVIKRHLTINQLAIGLYPINIDNTTKFLAFDVDGHHVDQPWKELTKSILNVCHKYQLKPLVELSQSGKGCHLWLFFAEPIKARKARELGDALLKEAQALDSRIPFTAFDRLFPAQDQLSKNKIGNLIAAPLEGQSLKEGNTSFVDDNWKPFDNQWETLSKVDLVSLKKVNEVINQIGEISNLSMDSNDEDDGLFKKQFFIDKAIKIVKANSLSIKKNQLTSEEILGLKWKASFFNPEFYKLQSVRMPVNNTPRIITLFEEDKDTLILPRGMVDELTAIIRKIDWLDITKSGTKLDVKFLGTLYDNQKLAYDKMINQNNGILAARTGFGKTVISAKLIAKHKVSTLILVPNKVLAEQWKQRLNQFLKIETEPVIVEYTPTGRKKHKEKIGTYFGQKKNPSGLVDIATIQAISKSPNSQEFLNNYGMVISDEVHHNAAYTFDEVIKQISCKYLYGLSATPYRRDGQEPILTLRFGPIRYQTDVIDPRFALTVKRTVIPRFTNLGMSDLKILNNNIVENRLAIQDDEPREQMLIRDINNCLKEKRRTIVFTSLISHVDKLYTKLPKDHLYKVYGGISSKERSAEIKKIKQDKQPFVILATPYVGGEGLDIPNLDTIIFTMPYSFEGNLEQYLGRLNRDLENKHSLKVIDYVDMFVPMLLRMYRKRKNAYKKLGYKITEDEYSQQSGLKLYNGNYQNALKLRLVTAKNVLIMAPILKKFIKSIISDLLSYDCKINICTQYETPDFNNRNVEVTKYAYNLPNCIIIDDSEMWVSSDIGFELDRGFTTRIDHSELVKQLKNMILKTI